MLTVLLQAATRGFFCWEDTTALFGSRTVENTSIGDRTHIYYFELSTCLIPILLFTFTQIIS